MSLTVFLAVLGAAFLHAGWNAMVKTGGSKLQAMCLMSLGQMVIGGLIALLFPLPPASVWVWLGASALIHTAYQYLLASAFERGDLSRVYPLSRGSAPVLVLVFAVFALDESLSASALCGILVLGCGIALMARGVFAGQENLHLLPHAFGAAFATATYTIVDGLGARNWGEPVAFVSWVLMITGVLFSGLIVSLRGREVLQAAPRDWAMGVLAGLASILAYGIAVWAITRAPLALVAALRETSILFAVLIGWLFLGERMDRFKVLAAGLIVCGVVLTRL